MKRNFCLICWIAVGLFLPLCASAAVAQNGRDENLVLGMAYTIETSVPTAHSYSNYSENGVQYDIDSGQLTDGVYAQTGSNDAAWYRAFRSRSRYVTFSFEEPVAVSGFSAGFYHGDGYCAPRYVNLYLSDNGADWFLAGTAKPTFSLDASARRYQAELSVERYAAQYVRVEFCCDIFVCCDEIEVYGSRELSGAEQTFTPDPAIEEAYCTSIAGDSYNISEIVKIYNGYYPSNQDYVCNTTQELLPYIAYLGEDGEILDTMFDAVAFVPCVSTDFAYPSGGTLVKTSKFPSAVQSDWIYYTEYLFAEGYELSALNAAVQQVYKALGKDPETDGKFPVFLTMPYPGSMEVPFGDLDGDGVAESCRTADERMEVIAWYDGYLTGRFAEADYAYLDFIGYYWYEEEINASWSSDELEFTTGALALLEAAGKVVLFDPFYLSAGFDQWEELGFEGAVMQPNVAFTDSRAYFDTEMLWEFAEAIAAYHLGVEIETNEPSFFLSSATVAEAGRNYERYLYVGWKTGYMDAIHTFYQGAGPGTLYQFCYADTGSAEGLRLRRLYDITYAFLKGTYVNQPPVVSYPEHIEAVAGEKCTVALSVADTDSFAGDLIVEASGCKHGRVQVTANRGSLLYLPEEGYVGEDTILLTVSDGQNSPAEYEISVSVSMPTAESGLEPEDSKPNIRFWLFAGLGAGLLLLAVFVLVLVLKRKKNA